MFLRTDDPTVCPTSSSNIVTCRNISCVCIQCMTLNGKQFSVMTYTLRLQHIVIYFFYIYRLVCMYVNLNLNLQYSFKKIQRKSIFTAKFVVLHCTLCKLRRDFGFFYIPSIIWVGRGYCTLAQLGPQTENDSIECSKIAKEIAMVSGNCRG